MRIIFAGSSSFACPSLTALLGCKEHSVCCVLTQPDRRAGRGLQLSETPVKQLLGQQAPLLQPTSLSDSVIDELASYEADIMVVVAYGLMIPPRLLDLFPYGCVNIHPSALPRYRGSSPIQAAIANGDDSCVVTLMRMDEGWDSGPIIAQDVIALDQTETSEQLLEKASTVGSKLLVNSLNHADDWVLTPQVGQPSYAKKIQKNALEIDLSWSSVVIERFVRAFGDYGCYLNIGGKNIIIHQVVIQDSAINDRSHFVNNGLIKCGDDQNILIKTWTIPGKAKRSLDDGHAPLRIDH